MIPRKINYVWLSGRPLNLVARRCVSSWKKVMPDFEIKRWTMKDFDFSTMPLFVKQALEKKKWAFVTDYLRLYILYKEGGIYLDSDVLVTRSFSPFLENSFFSSIELHKNDFIPYRHLLDEEGNAKADHIPGFCMQAAIMGSEKSHPFIYKCMEYYKNRPFIQKDGSLYTTFIAPDIFAFCARDYGFKYIDSLQHLENGMTIYDSTVFAGSLYERHINNYAIHTCSGSWREMSFLQKLKVLFFQLKEITSIKPQS